MAETIREMWPSFTPRPSRTPTQVKGPVGVSTVTLEPHEEGTPGHTDFYPTLEGTSINPVAFQAADCSCGDFTVSRSSYEAGYLWCDYGWMGPTSVYNALEFNILQQSTVELTRQDVNDSLESTHQYADQASADKHLTVIENGATNFIYALTYPIESTPLVCGEGQGVFLAGDKFKVTLRLDSCDMFTNENDYVKIMDTLKGCALSAIAKHE